MASFDGVRRARAALVVVACGVVGPSLACRGSARNEAERPGPSAAKIAVAPSAGATAPPARTPIEKQWGIRPVSIRPASGGYLLYFRYQVLDAAKARALFDEKVKPVLVDRETGTSLAMPEDTKLGALRSSPRTRPEEGKQYFVLFRNATRSVKKGSRVDVVMSGCEMKDLVVE